MAPPTVLVWILERTLPSHDRDAVLGDLLEEFAQRGAGARTWFWRQALGSVVPLLTTSLARQEGSGIALPFAFGYLLFAIPLLALEYMRTFALSQVPFRTGADPGVLWLLLILAGNVAGFLSGTAFVIRKLRS